MRAHHLEATQFHTTWNANEKIYVPAYLVRIDGKWQIELIGPDWLMADLNREFQSHEQHHSYISPPAEPMYNPYTAVEMKGLTQFTVFPTELARKG